MRWPTRRAMMSFGPPHDQPDRFAREVLRCRHGGQQHGQSGEKHAKSLHQSLRSLVMAGRDVPAISRL
jgi:hypothetical protein